MNAKDARLQRQDHGNGYSIAPGQSDGRVHRQPGEAERGCARARALYSGSQGTTHLYTVF